MLIDLLSRAPVGLLPVLIFLIVLLYMDSYKLVGIKTILWVMFVGALLPVAGYWINGYIIGLLGWDLQAYSRYVAPLIEGGLKAAILIFLFRTNRIGFMVDPTILGFAVGVGFSVVENIYYLNLTSDAHIALWVVRGFGTAIMHGGVAALFGVISQVLTERSIKINPLLYIPGLVFAVTLHSIYNHFPGSAILTTLGTLLILPPIFMLVYQHSARAMHNWLEVDFDEDALLLEQINLGTFTTSKIGRFLEELRHKLAGLIVVDMLCYLRLYTELALRAKGVLMMRENGLDTLVGERTRAKFEEMRCLEKTSAKPIAWPCGLSCK